MIQSVVRKNPAFGGLDFFGEIITIFLQILMRVLRFSIKYFSQFAKKAHDSKTQIRQGFFAFDV